jgi:hypothetical protein
MSSNATTNETSNVTSLPSTPKTQTAQTFGWSARDTQEDVIQGFAWFGRGSPSLSP